jgi:hypothetical protein
MNDGMAIKNPHAVALGSLGGKSRARNTTPEQRRRWARLGGLARAAKYEPEVLVKWAKRGGRPKKGKENADSRD